MHAHTQACLEAYLSSMKFMFCPFFLQHEMPPMRRQGLIYHVISRWQGLIIIMVILGLLLRMGLVCCHDETTITSWYNPVKTCSIFETWFCLKTKSQWPDRWFGLAEIFFFSSWYCPVRYSVRWILNSK